MGARLKNEIEEVKIVQLKAVFYSLERGVKDVAISRIEMG